jgi:hypothetical protein
MREADALRRAKARRGRSMIFGDRFFFDFVILLAAGFFLVGRFVPDFLRVAMAALRNRLSVAG